VRAKIPSFAWNSDRREREINRFGKARKFRAGLDASPQDARPALIREKSGAAEIYRDWRLLPNRAQRDAHRVQQFFRALADKF
jgi:hypothetical protein